MIYAMPQSPTVANPHILTEFRGMHDQRDTLTRPQGTVTTMRNMIDEQIGDSNRRLGRTFDHLETGAIGDIFVFDWDDGGYTPIYQANTGAAAGGTASFGTIIYGGGGTILGSGGTPTGTVGFPIIPPHPHPCSLAWNYSALSASDTSGINIVTDEEKRCFNFDGFYETTQVKFYNGSFNAATSTQKTVEAVKLDKIQSNSSFPTFGQHYTDAVYGTITITGNLPSIIGISEEYAMTYTDDSTTYEIGLGDGFNINKTIGYSLSTVPYGGASSVEPCSGGGKPGHVIVITGFFLKTLVLTCV